MNELAPGFQSVIKDICDRDYRNFEPDRMTRVAWAYYFFSIQFRENLQAALVLYPQDTQLQDLARGECDTDNLSPWRGIAAEGEKMNHDEFMRRVLTLSPLNEPSRARIERAGQRYLDVVRGVDPLTKAMSIASYEDGGLERLFEAFLQAPCWNTPLLEGFRHFLQMHIHFDSDPDAGHGSLCRHLNPDHRIRPLWLAFRGLLDEALAA